MKLRAPSTTEIDDVRALFREYERWLDYDLCFQGFESELAGLPGRYAPPSGRLWLAEVDGQLAGCVGLRELEPGICEMKRLYVRPDRRGLGIGLALSRAVIEQARKRGYGRMRLDTVASMVEATRLYETLGFREIRPYRHNPVPGARFFELDLHSAGAQNSRRRQASRPRGGR